jgi:sec-independent protein translocase protein TatC
MKQSPKIEATFWEHLDELRKVIFKSLAVVVTFAAVAFVFKDFVFDIILAPSDNHFVTFTLLCKIGKWLAINLCFEPFTRQLINTQLASQFMIHLSMSFYIGLLIAFPYVVYQLFRFISPALYQNEIKYSAKVISFSALLFFFGVLFNYFIIFPLSFRFLATYQVSSQVVNMINLSSYIDTLILLSLMIGLMSELPILAWFLAKLGVISDKMMKKYRRHVIVILLILCAIITPTADIFTLFMVFMPIYFFYELSIVIVRKSILN